MCSRTSRAGASDVQNRSRVCFEEREREHLGVFFAKALWSETRLQAGALGDSRRLVSPRRRRGRRKRRLARARVARERRDPRVLSHLLSSRSRFRVKKRTPVESDSRPIVPTCVHFGKNAPFRLSSDRSRTHVRRTALSGLRCRSPRARTASVSPSTSSTCRRPRRRPVSCPRTSRSSSRIIRPRNNPPSSPHSPSSSRQEWNRA